MAEAIAEIHAHSSIQVIRQSAVVETAPVGPGEQRDYLNAVIEVASTLSPIGLLSALLNIELSMGRERLEKWGPRTIDLDILLFGDAAIDEVDATTGLHITIPHPRLHERMFVLSPMLEIAADVRHPVLGKTIRELYAKACAQ